MKKLFTLFTVLLISVFAWAQSPKLSYQAVIRDGQNKLVVEQPVTVTVNVLKADNTSQFEQTFNATTNRNGLIIIDGRPCLGHPTMKDADQNTYPTVMIGNQCWMAKNMRCTSGITNKGTNYTETSSTNAYAYQPEGDVNTYGLLYNWPAAKTVCPTGWHLPTDADWNELTYYVYNSKKPVYKSANCATSGWDQDYTSCIANSLTDSTGWNNRNNQGIYAGNKSDSRNLTGFSAVPAGRVGVASTEYDEFSTHAYFWSSTSNPNSSSYAINRYLNSNDSYVTRKIWAEIYLGYSVRCVMD